MKIGIIPMSAKPFHAGHNSLIRFAAGLELLDKLVELGYAEQQNDKVNVYVSYSSRGVKNRTKKGVKFEVPIEGEAPVFGKDMEYIWNNILTTDNLGYTGTNVSIVTPRESGIASPVRAGFDVANAFKDAKQNNLAQWIDPISGETYNTDETIITFYCGEDDLNRYSSEMMTRYYGDLYSNGLISVIGIPRVVSISGTQMRLYLVSGDIESLKKMLPSDLSEENKEKIAVTLARSVELGRPSSQEYSTNESLIKDYVSLFIS
ncbi:MAG: hypothetical protein EBY39_11970 [Flavobacteriia bacterium]|nr:hypothetical protein [Flavobacteriia bacterium]